MDPSPTATAVAAAAAPIMDLGQAHQLLLLVIPIATSVLLQLFKRFSPNVDGRIVLFAAPIVGMIVNAVSQWLGVPIGGMTEAAVSGAGATWLYEGAMRTVGGKPTAPTGPIGSVGQPPPPPA